MHLEPRSNRRRKPPKAKKSGILFFSISIPIVLVLVALFVWKWNGDMGSQNGEQNNQASGGIVSASPTPKPSGEPVTPSPKPKSTPTSSPVIEHQAQDKGNGSVTMTFVGDVMMSDKVEGILKEQGYDYPYTHVKSFFEQADLSIANLETPITKNGTKQIKEYSYQSSPEALPPLAAAGIDLVNLANNHSMDRGPDGLLDTLKHLDDAAIAHVGAGKNIEEAYQPVIMEKNGMKLAFLGLSHVIPEASWKATKNGPGLTQVYNPTDAEKAIANAKQEADVVIVIAHWGIEREDMRSKEQKNLAMRFIDAGADLIVGSHPHVLQGFEQYKGKWIAYSLGNFIFSTNEYPKTLETAILQVTMTKDGNSEINIVPVLTQYALPKPMIGNKADELLKRISSISIGAKVELLGDGTGKVTTK